MQRMENKIGQDIHTAAKLLQQGEVVAIPTETVYGLAANALNKKAVQKIYQVKNRPSTNPLIIHLAEINQISQYVSEIPTAAHKLIERFCPGPLTVVLPRKSIVPDWITAGRDTVAIRIPAHPVARALLQTLDFPLAAPSANPSGYISPTKAEHVLRTLGNKVNYILDGGACQTGIESTIVGFENNKPILLRQGKITAQEIERVVGDIQEYNGTETLSPGLSKSHYSPNTRVVLSENLEASIQEHADKRIGIITYNHYTDNIEHEHQIILCEDNQFETAAKHLYESLHQMDQRAYEILIVKTFPPIGIGKAINDRLQRAETKHPLISF